ncbi:MAG: hypothetical protein JSC189_000900 [Candidatus Tokpelaia sp. JSC189]|nr:MAG: hypothetical protein JSC189_000900 [Candidatus Tokpelaia sp. JSC189]
MDFDEYYDEFTGECERYLAASRSGFEDEGA